MKRFSLSPFPFYVIVERRRIYWRITTAPQVCCCSALQQVTLKNPGAHFVWNISYVMKCKSLVHLPILLFHAFWCNPTKEMFCFLFFVRNYAIQFQISWLKEECIFSLIKNYIHIEHTRFNKFLCILNYFHQWDVLFSFFCVELRNIIFSNSLFNCHFWTKGCMANSS
jgi:hypothetical protein